MKDAPTTKNEEGSRGETRVPKQPSILHPPHWLIQGAIYLLAVFVGLAFSPTGLILARIFGLLPVNSRLMWVLAQGIHISCLMCFSSPLLLLGLPALCVWMVRRSGWRVWLPSFVLVFVIFCLGWIHPPFGWLGTYRTTALHRAAQNSQPLVDAIEKYKKNKGEYPESLDQLLPEYLSKLPFTGMVGHQKYRYWRHDEPEEVYGITLSDYSLRISLAYGLDFDHFEYWPAQNYPQSFQRIGDWAFFDD